MYGVPFVVLFKTKSHYVALTIPYVDQAGPEPTEHLVLKLKACSHCASNTHSYYLCYLHLPSPQIQLLTSPDVNFSSIQTELFPLA